MGKDRQEELWPSWILLCSQVEPAREFYRKEMQRHAALFEKVMDALWEKIEGGQSGDKHFITPNPEYPHEVPYLDIICSGYESWQDRVLFIREDFIDMGFNRGRLTFICLKKRWDREADTYRYDYAKRILRLTPSKLAETALTVVEQDPPEDRRWIQEEGARHVDDVDMEKALGGLLEEIASWKPVEKTS